ncbi:ABC transporter ATP-binding protein/permease [Demequina sp.]|uniref:ABC transporter ATP-binding protein/permease n=1 Tax=Demequina sp. TaxID=2050685 RepID=UPI0025BC7F68|nr:ABC transporter ATP-binding protein/permease [Demequina sp.]
MLSLRNVVRHYGNASELPALRGVSLDVSLGEFVAIEGPSGAGKSTLVNILGLLDRPDAGEYRVFGHETSGLSPNEAARLRSDTFSFVFQGFHLLDDRPAIESVELGLAYRGVESEVRGQRAREALERVGIGALGEKPAGLLSGGERQRVAIARALATGAPVLLADEPTGNLDSRNSEQLVEALSELNRQGTTVILVTHSETVASAAGRRVLLEDGSISMDSDSSGRASIDGSPPEAPPGTSSRVRILALIADALGTLAARPRRTVAMAGAVAIGIALATGTLGVGLTARAQVSDAFDARTNRDVSVQWADPSAGPMDSDGLSTTLSSLGFLNGVDVVGIVSDFGGTSVEVARGRAPVVARQYAIQGDLLTAARAEVDWASDLDEHVGTHEALVGANLAQQLELGPISARPTIVVDGDTYSVVGVVHTSPRVPEMLAAVVIAASERPGIAPTTITAVLLTEVGAAQQVAREAPIAINPYEPNELYVVAPVDPRELRDEIEASVATTLAVVTIVAFLGGLGGLANAMLLSVGERTREFGLRRAVGARSIHVAGLVTSEAMVTGVLGGFIGLSVGLAALLVISVVNGWQPVFDLRLAPAAVALGAVIGAIGGLFAARRAMRIEPHEALRA